MKTLVYTTAFGEDLFFRLAEQMFRSLRLRGYTGDAAILCDRPPEFAAALRVDAIVPGNIADFPLLKARLSRFREVSGYDQILFADSDVVFLRDPAPLLALASERMMVSRDHFPLGRNSFNLTFLSPSTRRDPALRTQRSLNSGILAFPGIRYEEYAEKWIGAWHSEGVLKKIAHHPPRSAELRDQPVLQKLVAEDGLDCGYFPDPLILMPLFFTENHPLHPDAVALHLNGSSRSPQQKTRLLALMADLNGMHRPADFRRVCDGLQAGRRRAGFSAPPGRGPHNAIRF